jgi:hypothetical protein
LFEKVEESVIEEQKSAMFFGGEFDESKLGDTS